MRDKAIGKTLLSSQMRSSMPRDIAGMSPQQPLVMPGCGRFTLRSSETDLDYEIFVYVPEAEPPASGFPVIYVLDANSDFITVAETVRRVSPPEGDRHRSCDRGRDRLSQYERIQHRPPPPGLYTRSRGYKRISRQGRGRLWRAGGLYPLPWQSIAALYPIMAWQRSGQSHSARPFACRLFRA